eukprot:gnl/Ergobibamus_cyprinoides/763.p1 GENE.gnl/Ergobibamus_cyprinoides/763~~gnl/Ergobibamus_cyprinoides/763.p1  ORF type:complete len:348 (+),score=85.81 gnl/Ergobibamus_cyprinoides/763:157-1044(+)
MLPFHVSYHRRLAAAGVPHSYLLDANWRMKLRHLVPVSVLFAADLSLNNSGLAKTSVSIHVLLKATAVIWTVLLAWWLTHERPNVHTVGCCAMMVCGGTLIFAEVVHLQGLGASATLGMVFTILSSVLGSVYLVLMKRALLALRAAGITLHPTETTPLNIGFVAIFMFALVPVFEPGAFTALLLEPIPTYLVLAGGTGLTLLMKLSTIWLITRQKVASVGIIGEARIVAQILLDMLFFHKYPLNAPMVLGAAVVTAGAVLYARRRRLVNAARAAEKVALLAGPSGTDQEDDVLAD